MAPERKRGTSRSPGAGTLLDEIERLERAQDEMRERHGAEVERLSGELRSLVGLVDCLPGAVFTVDHEDGRIVEVNPAGVRLTRASAPADLVGRPITDLLDPGDVVEFDDERRRALAGEPTGPPLPGRLVALDGTVFDVEQMLRGGERGGRPSYYALFRETTRERETLGALRDSEARFRDLSESSIQGVNVATFDRELRPLYANAAFLAIFGFDSLAAYLREASDECVFAPHELDRLREMRLRRLDGQAVPEEIEFDGVRRDGAAIRVRRLVKPLSRPWEGRPALLCVNVDVTDRARAEEALEASEARFRDLAESSVLGISVSSVGERAELLYVNDGFLSMFRFEDAGQVLGRDAVAVVVAPHERDRVYGYRRARMEGIPQLDDFEIDGERADGSFIRVRVMVRLLAQPWAGQQAALATLSDVTDRFIAERELERHQGELEALVGERTRELSEAQAELLRNERLAALGRVVATVGHELRNPLGTITASLTALREDGLGAERAERAFARIERAVARCAEIVDEMLDFTRDRAIERSRVNCAEWLATSLEDLEDGLGVSVESTIGCESAIDLDARRMGQVIANLVVNAAHATLEREPERPPPVLVRTACEADQLVIEVTDQGMGMTPEVRERIFEPLYSTKPLGVGLGMPLVAKVVEQHGGTVEVRSAPGAGTTVIVRVPDAVRSGERP